MARSASDHDQVRILHSVLYVYIMHAFKQIQYTHLVTSNDYKIDQK